MIRKIAIITFIFLFLIPALHVSGQNSNGNPHLRTIVIDPGHGGKDPGAPGPDSRNCEKNIVLNIARLFGERIRKEYPSVKVVYTRSGDTFPKLTDRVKTAHDHNADLFISIHCNSSATKSASGSSAHILARKDSRNPNRDLFDENVELTKLENSVIEFEEDKSSYYDTAEDQILNSLLFQANFNYSVMLAQLVVENLATSPFHKWGKGVHQNDFLLLKKMTCPAILVECAFLSNTAERQLLVSGKWQQEIADRLFKAFKEYKAVYDASMTPSETYEPSDAATEPVRKETSVDRETPAKVETAPYYTIQIMGLGRLLKEGDSAFKGLKAKPFKESGSSVYKYIYGKYSSRSEAASHLPTVKKKFPEAFVVKVENGKITRAK